MLTVEINRWLGEAKADYSQGVELVKQLDPKAPLLAVLKIGDTSFCRSKIREFLESHLQPIEHSLKIEQAAAVVDDNKEKYTPTMYFTLPDNLQALEREKSALFSQIIKARNQIKKIIGFKKPETIHLSDVLKLMTAHDSKGNPIPFSISYLSADLEAKTGGQWKHHPIAFCSFQNRSGTKNYTGASAEKKRPKKTNHWLNATRNIYLQQANQLHCIHIWLIFEFNGKEVIIGQPG